MWLKRSTQPFESQAIDEIEYKRAELTSSAAPRDANHILLVARKLEPRSVMNAVNERANSIVST